MLERLVCELDGQENEFRILWERAKLDQCDPQERNIIDGAREIPDGLSITGSTSWLDTLGIAASCFEDVTARLADTIVSLTLLIDATASPESVESLRLARAWCWLEIANRIDTGTPNGKLCAMACRMSSEVDGLPPTARSLHWRPGELPPESGHPLA